MIRARRMIAGGSDTSTACVATTGYGARVGEDPVDILPFDAAEQRYVGRLGDSRRRGDAAVAGQDHDTERVLIADDYFQALRRDNVELVTSGIDYFEEHAVITRDGRRIAVDCVILAAGFESTSFLAPMTIHGTGGRSLHDEWKGHARAYLGSTARASRWVTDQKVAAA